MATTPPNPFDPQEVQKYLDRKNPAEVTKSRRAEELADDTSSPAVGSSSPAAVMGRADLIGADTPAAEAVEMYNYWKAQGSEVYAEAVGAFIDAIASEAAVLDETPTVDRPDLDAVLTSSRLGKSIEAAGKKLYSAGRTVLWEMVRHQNGKHTTPRGETFRFKAGARTTTRVDHKRFRNKYPEVYAEVVKITEKSSNTPGYLYL